MKTIRYIGGDKRTREAMLAEAIDEYWVKEAAKRAISDIKAARIRLNEAHGRLEIDAAIYEMAAAECRYDRIRQEAKQKCLA